MREWYAPATNPMLDLAHIDVGSRVLDIAAGDYDQSITIASRVGPHGYVLAMDMAEKLLEIDAPLKGENEMLFKNLKLKLFRTISRISLAGLVLAVVAAVAFTASSPQPAFADQIIVPPVPTQIQVPTGNKVFLVGHAIGTQNYVCAPSGAGFAWTLFTPEATLFSEDGGQVITHFFSPNPFEPNTNPRVVSPLGTIRATWQHRDTSTVWAKLHINPDGTPGAVTVDPNAIAWLLLDVVGAQNGPTGGDVLTKTTFVQRLSTTGGLAPSVDCASSVDLGKQAFIPYTADYFFYKKVN